VAVYVPAMMVSVTSTPSASNVVVNGAAGIVADSV
jgi:hypothetical protein